MMISIVLADRSTIRVESCPVPVMVDFPEWRVYAHNIITEDGVDESRWCATEARTGHSFPGEYPASDDASLAAMATLRRWGKPKAASTFVNARRRLERLGIAFPVNDVGPLSISAATKDRVMKPDARLWRVLELLHGSVPLSIYEIAKFFPECSVAQIQSTVRALRSLGIVSKMGPHMASRYYVARAVAA